jgi:hypothetical protein
MRQGNGKLVSEVSIRFSLSPPVGEGIKPLNYFRPRVGFVVTRSINQSTFRPLRVSELDNKSPNLREQFCCQIYRVSFALRFLNLSNGLQLNNTRDEYSYNLQADGFISRGAGYLDGSVDTAMSCADGQVLLHSTPFIPWRDHGEEQNMAGQLSIIRPCLFALAR